MPVYKDKKTQKGGPSLREPLHPTLGFTASKAQRKRASGILNLGVDGGMQGVRPSCQRGWGARTERKDERGAGEDGVGRAGTGWKCRSRCRKRWEGQRGGGKSALSGKWERVGEVGAVHCEGGIACRPV